MIRALAVASAVVVGLASAVFAGEAPTRALTDGEAHGEAHPGVRPSPPDLP